jgi:hypothetical protein
MVFELLFYPQITKTHTQSQIYTTVELSMLVNFQMGDKIPHVSECEEKKLFIAPEL